MELSPVQTAPSIPNKPLPAQRLAASLFLLFIFLQMDGGRASRGGNSFGDPGYVMGRKDRAFFFPLSVTLPGFQRIFRRAAMPLEKFCWEQGAQKGSLSSAGLSEHGSHLEKLFFPLKNKTKCFPKLSKGENPHESSIAVLMADPSRLQGGDRNP